jgi:hypothetical protein
MQTTLISLTSRHSIKLKTRRSTQTDIVIDPHTKLSTNNHSTWNLLYDTKNSLKEVTLQNTNDKTCQTKMTFLNTNKITSRYKIEFSRKKSHILILTVHANQNTTPKPLNKENFPAALLDTDLKLQREIDQLIVKTQSTSIKRLKELINEIESNLLILKSETQMYERFETSFFKKLRKK